MDLRITRSIPRPVPPGRQRAFTLVELVIVIVVLGILATVALPKFFDMSADAKQAACKGSLGTVRSAIANFYANKAMPSGGHLVSTEACKIAVQGPHIDRLVPDSRAAGEDG